VVALLGYAAMACVPVLAFIRGAELAVVIGRSFAPLAHTGRGGSGTSPALGWLRVRAGLVPGLSASAP
jgi:hypothetical protein